MLWVSWDVCYIEASKWFGRIHGKLFRQSPRHQWHKKSNCWTPKFYKYIMTLTNKRKIKRTAVRMSAKVARGSIVCPSKSWLRRWLFSLLANHWELRRYWMIELRYIPFLSVISKSWGSCKISYNQSGSSLKTYNVLYNRTFLLISKQAPDSSPWPLRLLYCLCFRSWIYQRNHSDPERARRPWFWVYRGIEEFDLWSNKRVNDC